jgi:predicted DNA-binding transcriptional regulator AlpA
MKDTIILDGRTFDGTGMVMQRYGIAGQTLKNMVDNNIVPKPVRMGNKHYYDRKAIESHILATGQEWITEKKKPRAGKGTG